MIKEDYVSFETAKLLNEKGFDADTDYDMWYTAKRFSTGCHWNSCTYNVGDITREYDEKCCITMPTLQMAMKWLREVHNIYISISHRFSHNADNDVLFSWYINTDLAADGEYVTYEEGCEAAIKYCLEKLI